MPPETMEPWIGDRKWEKISGTGNPDVRGDVRALCDIIDEKYQQPCGDDDLRERC